MIQIKKEYNNGGIDVVEIYSIGKKIFEISKNIVWDATEENPITIPKNRLPDFMEIDIPNEGDAESKEIEENIDKVQE